MGREDTVRGVGRHWVVIETGGNQAFVFASNKQAVNVGASELIAQVSEKWVPDAVQQVTGVVDPVLLASGKALLLVDSVATGRALVRAVTSTALREAPGLDVWGVVDRSPIRNIDDIADALTRAHRLHAAWRGRRPLAQLRHPTLPFNAPCRYSGLPATGLGWEGDDLSPRASIIDAAWQAMPSGRDRMAAHLNEDAVARPTRINDGVSNNGWVAVVHADGNGIGEVFLRLGDAYRGDEFLARLEMFGTALSAVTIAALRVAVERHGASMPKGWILPLVVGGDDVTAMLDARVAFAVTSTFLREFARRSAMEPAIAEVLAELSRRGLWSAGAGLSGCAGIAYVKPHRSFAEAYQLAAALCASAKQVKDVDPRHGAIDFHVLHDSVGHDLATIRRPLAVVDGNTGGELRLWAGPIVVPVVSGVRDTAEHMSADSWIETRGVDQLTAAVDGLRGSPGCPPTLTRAQVHRLRAALFRGSVSAERAAQRIVQRASAGGADPVGTEDRDAAGYLARHLLIPDPRSGTRFSRVVSAVDLLDVEAGSAPAGRIATEGPNAIAPVGVR